MTLPGWIFMILSWTVILGLFGYCMKRTLTPPAKKTEDKNTESEQQSES